MTEEWNDCCPECGSCNVDDYDVDGMMDIYFWKCLDCGWKFKTMMIHVLIKDGDKSSLQKKVEKIKEKIANCDRG